MKMKNNTNDGDPETSIAYLAIPAGDGYRELPPAIFVKEAIPRKEPARSCKSKSIFCGATRIVAAVCFAAFAASGALCEFFLRHRQTLGPHQGDIPPGTASGDAAGIAAGGDMVGSWIAVDLQPGGDPGAPDESLIEITESSIFFPNGGGGFANGRYEVHPGGVIVKQHGKETITFARSGEQLRVTFAGGDYAAGNHQPAVAVVYERQP